MSRVALKLGCVLLTAACVSPLAWSGEFDARIARAAARVEMQVIEWRRTLHRNPERSNEEFETGRLIVEHLRKLGFEHVVTGIARTGVVGILEGGPPGPTVALRADIDAVSGVNEINDLPFRSTKDDVAHVCGHDAHTAMLLGVATVLSEMRDDLAGNVMFIFQPAEEGVLGDGLGPDEFGGSEGARLMIEEGMLGPGFLGGKYAPSVLFSQHITPRRAAEVSYVGGSRLFSSDWFKMVVTEAESTFQRDRGRGSGPHPAMAALIDTMNGFPTRPANRIVPALSRLGIVSVHTVDRSSDPTAKRSVEVVARLGATTNEAREHGIAWIQDVAKSVADETGTSITVTTSAFAPPVVNDPDLVAMMRPSIVNAVGEENLSEESFISPAADDVALFMERVPGIFILLGGNREGVKSGEAPLNHSPEFFVNEDILVPGVKILSTLTADYLAAESRKKAIEPAGSAGRR